jgi:glycosyltransferase involved in cell wall biosynthesis
MCVLPMPESPDSSASVIIPAHNAEGCLRDAVDSALNQRLSPAEVIVVNDGSTDGTDAVAKSYGRRIVYLEQENLGPGAARNVGLAQAKGTYVAFLDADDYWKPEFLQECVTFLRSHEEVIVVSTGLVTRMLDGTEMVHPAALCGGEAACKAPYVIEDFFDTWARFDHVRTGSVVIRRSVVERVGLQRADLRLAQDLEYWAYLATFGRWGFIPQPLWVGNSRQRAREKGWAKKYRPRRRLCPDLEQWESRVIPRLAPPQRASFEVVRGRIALWYAQNKILAGARAPARRLVLKYGRLMPSCATSRVMQLGVRGGWLGWRLACTVISCWEWMKAAGLRTGR